MTLDEAIKHAEEATKEQEELYALCPASEYRCDGAKDCKALKNGKNKGCQKCAADHRQLAEWLKELKQLREQTRWIPVSESLPKESNTYEVTLQGIAELEGIDNEVAYATWLENRKNWLYHDVDNWKDKKVIAWKPLSKPFKTENEE